uniref:Uncharacterized protein n=1 Tax=Oryza glumipatula TaxID=40148 RepID=A0A0D9ZL47_9ORYZ
MVWRRASGSALSRSPVEMVSGQLLFLARRNESTAVSSRDLSLSRVVTKPSILSHSPGEPPPRRGMNSAPSRLRNGAERHRCLHRLESTHVRTTSRAAMKDMTVLTSARTSGRAPSRSSPPVVDVDRPPLRWRWRRRWRLATGSIAGRYDRDVVVAGEDAMEYPLGMLLFPTDDKGE